MKWAKTIRRLLAAAALLFYPAIHMREFILHYEYHFSGEILETIVRGNWMLVFFNIVVFTAVLVPLSYRRRADWGEYGLVSAFFVSLFIEMYGLPLTIFLAYSYFMPRFSPPPIAATAPMVGETLGLTHAMAYGSALILVGAALIITGWVTLYRHSKGDFVSNGVYRYSRHPQYAGFIVLLIGWWVGWPTPLTTILTPILIYKYLKVCKKEEKELMKVKGYRKYVDETPMFL